MDGGQRTIYYPQTHTGEHRQAFPQRQLTLRWMAAAAAMVVLLFMESCSTNRPPIIDSYGLRPVSGVEKQLRRNAEKWQGVPYRYGGDSRRGIDCSALVAKIYAATFDVALPRTVQRQMTVGYSVDRQPLAAGDIVFFDAGGYGPHAGIYLGRGEFIHASSRKGVIVSNINTQYWRRHYVTARRLPALTDRF